MWLTKPKKVLLQLVGNLLAKRARPSDLVTVAVPSFIVSAVNALLDEKASGTLSSICVEVPP